MSFREDFSGITKGEFKDGVCRIEVGGYPFTVKLDQETAEIKFPLPENQNGPVAAYQVFSEINAFLEKQSSFEDSVQPKETDQPEAAELFSHEWCSPFYYIAFSGTEYEQSAQLCADLIERIAAALKKMGVPSDLCVLCGKTGADQNMLADGILCAVHKACAANIRPQGFAVPRLLCAYLVAFALCAAASLSFIPLSLLGIMPSLAGIPMGLAAAFGFWLICKNNPPKKWILLIMFILLGGAANFCGDYIYLMHSGAEFDFNATFTFSMNIINSVFDIISSAVIAHFSAVIIYDLFYSQPSMRKFNPKTKKPIE